jgi:hypothetical protein
VSIYITEKGLGKSQHEEKKGKAFLGGCLSSIESVYLYKTKAQVSVGREYTLRA